MTTISWRTASCEAVGDGRDDDRIGVGNRLQAGHQVRSLADRGVLLRHALANQVANHDHTRANGDAGLNHHACGGSYARDRLEDGKTGKDRPLCVVLVRGRIPEIGKHAVAKILRHHAVKGTNFGGATRVKRREDVALFLGIEPS